MLVAGRNTGARVIIDTHLVVRVTTDQAKLAVH
jgi:hypothetical protein